MVVKFLWGSILWISLGLLSVIMDLIHYLFAPLILFLVPYTLDLLP